jgi:hypothetical protein
MPMAMTRFDFLQFEALIVREISGHFAVCSDHDLVNTASGLFSYFCKLGGRFIDYWRYFGDLFWRQIQLCAEPIPHSDAHQFRMMKFKEKVSRMHRTKESTRHPTRDEDEDKAGN